MPLYTIHTHGQLQPHLSQEWLLTNGQGAYASSTVVGCNTRKYHGLLVAATMPPVGRIMALNRVAEIITFPKHEEQLFELSCNQFGDQFHPKGYQYLSTFESGDTIKWIYEIHNVKVEKELQLIWGENRIALRYTIDPAGRDCEFRLLPFVSLRDFHSVRKAGVHFDVIPVENGIFVRTGEHGVTLQSSEAEFVLSQDWWYGHTYAIETHRGQDDSEDLFSPGGFVLKTNQKTTLTLWASVGKYAPVDWTTALHRRPDPCQPNRSVVHCDTESPTIRRLIHAAGDFLVDRKNPDGSPGRTIIAGYPWFADWGRDTMISIPGLLLTTGRFDDAKQVLKVFAHYTSQGMIPNKFDDYTNQPSYNTVDASLWFIHAVFEYLKKSNDNATFEEHLLPACKQIIEGYRNGTRYHIKMDESDGLVSQGDENTQLTWMDARCDGVSFTPRQGKAVEINALWYHALVLMNEKELAKKVAENFRKAYWISPFRGLADVVNNGQQDKSIRPNQIFAVSLPNSPLTSEQQSAVVEVVRRELLTPVGLRSLAPGDPKFHATYGGPQCQRDAAYHNGTIWAWLIGPFLRAYLNVNQNSAASKDQARKWLTPLIDHMHTAGCIGSISEIFEATPPYRDEGCFAQAWSVAEVLRLAAELDM
ncbi:MAG TPA: amylo-alpha-1,6-glucosidase [Tepidisphaeraceae bacterium]|jgi:predicted glycogen debranching enzyme